jgi:outer membrane protein OmpA-like peptidoglycan-associated protein
MSTTFEAEGGDFEFDPEMGDFGEAEFDEAEFDEAEFDEAETEWESERVRRRPPLSPFVRPRILPRPQAWSRSFTASRPPGWPARPRFAPRPFVGSRPLRWAAWPRFASRPFATAQPYRWPARATFAPRLYAAQQFPGRYYRYGRPTFFPATTAGWATPRRGYWDRWGRWIARRRYPFGRWRYAGSAYAQPPYYGEPLPEPPYTEPPYVEPPYVGPAGVPPPIAPPAMAEPAMPPPAMAPSPMMEPPVMPPIVEPSGTAPSPAPGQPAAGDLYIEPETFEFDPELDEYQGEWGELEGEFDQYEAAQRASPCPPYQPGEVEKSKTPQGHLPSDFIQDSRGTLIADFGVDWRHTKPGLARDAALRSWLNQLIQQMRTNPNLGITIFGFSDCVGRENNNRFLRRGRALRVKQLLLQLAGADRSLLEDRIFADAAAPGEFVADNGTIEGRAQNRGALILPTEIINVQGRAPGRRTRMP